MKKNQLTAVILQRLFLVGILLLVVGAVFGFTFLGKLLQDKAMQVSHAQTDASIGSNNVKQLEQLNKDLEKHKDVVQRAKEIVADSRSYQYQNQIIQDINSFADRVGITILGYDFSSSDSASEGSPSSTPSSGSTSSSNSSPSSPPSPTSPNTTSPSSTTPPGVRTVTAKITLKNPVPYTSFLKLLKLIEQNVTKMQVTGVALSPDASHPDQISNPTIGLIVYVR